MIKADRILTEKIKAELLNNGMDLVGFAPVDRWQHAPFMLSPEAVLPGSRSVIVMAMHLTETWIEMGGNPDPQVVGPGGMVDINAYIDRFSYKTVRLLQQYGHQAVAVAASNVWRFRAYEGIPGFFTADISHLHAAAAAGLSQIGWSGLSITPEYGPRIRFATVVTDALLVPTPLYDKSKLCDMCMDCVKHCPSAAMRKDILKNPNVVRIEDKEFRYANKNLWRCAWAEHFNLDLDSKTLEKDHIDESDVLSELKKGQTRGHERGVCQKVCLPPHLRSGQPSFGRDGKLIVSARVNKKYPDTMPTLRKLRDDAIALGVKLGATIVGVKPLDMVSKAGQAVEMEAPGMKSVIGLAMSVPRETKNIDRQDVYQHQPYAYALPRMMFNLTLRMAKFLEELGYHAVPYTGYIPGEADDLSRIRQEVTYVHGGHEMDTRMLACELAEMAGVGSIGRAFTTCENGEDILTGAVVTDAPLDALTDVDCPEVSALVRRPDAQRLRTELECLAMAQDLTQIGVASAQVFDGLADDLRQNLDESELGQDVLDDNSEYHGRWISRISDQPRSIKVPKDYLPNARSVVMLSLNLSPELVANTGRDTTKQIGTYATAQFNTCFELRFAAMEMATRLNQYGYQTVVTENLLGIGSQVDTPRGRLPDARCNALEACAAGLGDIGRNGALLTEKYGPHQRQIAIITDAPLRADAPYAGPRVCTDCGNCESKCPMAALANQSFKVRIGQRTINYPLITRHRCDWAKKFALNREEGGYLAGNNTHIVPDHAGEVTIAEIAAACEQKDPLMKRRSCIVEPCQLYCQAGGKTEQ